jgi:hypothetical protein
MIRMKSITLALLLTISVAAIPHTALAQEELIEDMHVVKNCAGEVRRLCPGVEPGEGRIKACLRQNLGKIKPACFQSILGAMIAIREAPTIKLNPGAETGIQVHLSNARDYAYCEIAPIVGTPSNVVAQFYNTSGTTGPEGGCPADAFAAISEKSLSEKLAAAVTYLNPTPQTARRHWVMDEVWVFVAGETVDFEGVNATWMASMSARDMLSALNSGPYMGTEIHRRTRYLYANDSTVFLIHTTNKKTYVMQSYATEVDKNLAFDQLPKLGDKLKLPSGWSFESKTLARDLTIDPRKANGVALSCATIYMTYTKVAASMPLAITFPEAFGRSIDIEKAEAHL